MKMNRYQIVNTHTDEIYCEIKAASELSALAKYKHGLTQSGFYYIEKENGRYILSTTFGLYLRADKKES